MASISAPNSSLHQSMNDSVRAPSDGSAYAQTVERGAEIQCLGGVSHFNATQARSCAADAEQLSASYRFPFEIMIFLGEAGRMESTLAWMTQHLSR